MRRAYRSSAGKGACCTVSRSTCFMVWMQEVLTRPRRVCELVLVMQAKPACGRLTWLVEACVRELCGSNHATPLKLEVDCLNVIRACSSCTGLSESTCLPDIATLMRNRPGHAMVLCCNYLPPGILCMAWSENQRAQLCIPHTCSFLHSLLLPLLGLPWPSGMLLLTQKGV